MLNDSNASKKILSWKNQLLESVIRLVDLNVPCHIIYFEKKQVSQFGTSNVTEKFQKETSCECHYNCNINNNTTWLEALKNDVLKLVDRNEGSIKMQESLNQ